jgi:GNAT superfamily N-acetyltransferase
MPAQHSPAVRIARVTAAQVRPLREAVLRPGEPPERSVYPGDDEADTFHAAALLDGRIVGSATVIRQSPAHETVADSWRLRGVTTLPEVRGTGCGALLLRAVTAYVASQGCRYLWMFANPPAVGFYLRLGFQIQDGAQNVVPVGAPHPLMWRLITPADVAQPLGGPSPLA